MLDEEEEEVVQTRQVNVRALLSYFHLKATPARTEPSRTARGPGLTLHMKAVAEEKKRSAGGGRCALEG